MSDEFPLHLLTEEESVVELDDGEVEVTPSGLAWTQGETPEDDHRDDMVV